MDKRGINGPVGLIIVFAFFILILAFTYPIIKSVITWFAEINFLLKFIIIIVIFMSIYTLLNEFQPKSSI
ncbi:MAG: hypothetical protein AABW56_01630 [Nanoarchaeota archaeon]